jgi:DNA-binding transcriptional LysR family regulator
VPAILAFKTRYPNMAFNLRLAPQMPDLLEGGFDLALHADGTRLNDSEVVARRLGSFRLAIAACPRYLDTHGRPCHPQDLQRHNCLFFHNETVTDTWVFRLDDNEVTVKVGGDLHSNQGAALRLAAINDLGMVRLTEYRSMPRAVPAIYPQRTLMPDKPRSFVDFLAERFRREQDLATEDAGGVAVAVA